MTEVEPSANSHEPHSSGIMKIYREAVKNLPILRYSWVFIATICILALAAYFKLKNSDVFFYVFGVIIVSVVVFLLSLLLKSKTLFIKILSYILVTCIVITTGTGVLGFGSFIIWEKPSFFNRWFPTEGEKFTSKIEARKHYRELHYRLSRLDFFINRIDQTVNGERSGNGIYFWRVLTGNNAYDPLVSDFKNIPTPNLLAWFGTNTNIKSSNYERAETVLENLDNQRDATGNYDVQKVKESLSVLEDFDSELKDNLN